MKRNIILAIVVSVLSFQSHAQDNELPLKEHRTVFQMATGDSSAQVALVKQLNNFLNAVPDVKIEVVCHGPGINTLVTDKTKVYDQIQELTKRGVVFAACENTMKDKKITKDQIIPEATFVPAAIVELVKRQEEGWTYIKAGF
jgi:uncharacterized protein